MSELKACPFCKSTSNDVTDHSKDCYLRQMMKGIPDEGIDLVELFAVRPIEDALRNENERLQSLVHSMHTQLEVDMLRAENERLRLALEWYADEQNYSTGKYSEDMPKVEFDMGDIARAALSKNDKEAE